MEVEKTATSEEDASKKQPNTEVWIIAIAIFLVSISIFNAYQASAFKDTVQSKINALVEESKPAKIDLISINPECDGCSSAKSTLSELEGINTIKINSSIELNPDSAEAKALVQRYAIKSLPAIIATGEIAKASAIKSKFPSQARDVADAIVFDSPSPPYVDTATGNIKGNVQAIVIDKSNCAECQNLSSLITQLEKGGVHFSNIQEYSDTMFQAKEIINKYSITRLPVLILSNDLDAYDSITSIWPQIGTKEADSSFVFRQARPPYYDLATGNVTGIVSAVYLVDKTCNSCYDAETVHGGILANGGIFIGKTQTTDIKSAEGKALLAKYNITKIPTVILAGDVSAYPSLVSAWAQVGTIEKDGAYVFRSISVISQNYEDLAK